MNDVRTPDFARNRELDRVLAELASSLRPVADAAAERWPAPTRPLLLIVGPPRCGSTHLLQRLASTGTFGYPSNLVSRFHAAPYVGALAHRLLLDPALDHRGETGASTRGPQLDDVSVLGKTTGLENVNEFWHAWRHFLPVSDTDEFSAAQLEQIDRAGLAAMMGALEAGFDKPIVAKAQLLAFHAEVMAEVFPTAIFLRIRRRPAELVESILSARKLHGGSESAWWSLRPLGLDALVDLPEIDQVSAQVVAIEASLDRAAGEIGTRMLEIDFDELQRDPHMVDIRIRSALAPLGVDMAAPTTPAPTVTPQLAAARAAELSAAVTRAMVRTSPATPTAAAGDAMTAGIETDAIDATSDGEHLLLYSRRSFGRRTLRAGDRWMTAEVHDGTRLVGSLSGTVHGSTWWSGYSAPFGGPDFVRPVESPANVTRVLEAAMSKARQQGLSALRITLRPPSYSRNEGLVSHCAVQLGFRPVTSELSCAIDIGAMSDAGDYARSLKSAARKVLRRHENEPWGYRETADWADAYQLLVANRAAKGRNLRLDLDYLQGVREDHPGKLRMCILEHGGTPVAAALLYRLLPDVDSVQYWGDRPGALDFSPMPQLAAEVCGQAIADGVRIVDLGKSSIDGTPDEGLVRFKRRVGATAEPILTVERPV